MEHARLSFGVVANAQLAAIVNDFDNMETNELPVEAICLKLTFLHVNQSDATLRRVCDGAVW